MIDVKRRLKNFGPLEFLVLCSLFYVFVMLIWTASTRSSVLKKANDIKSNHKIVSYVIEGVPLWRNWTDEGEYDYIYPVKDSENNTIHIREKRILRKIGSDINHLSELKSNSSSEL